MKDHALIEVHLSINGNLKKSARVACASSSAVGFSWSVVNNNSEKGAKDNLHQPDSEAAGFSGTPGDIFFATG